MTDESNEGDRRIEIALTVLRAVVGITFVVAGVAKLREPAGAIADFDRWGMPFPRALAIGGGTVEILAGSVLLVGFAARGAALLLAIDAVGGLATEGRIEGGTDLVRLLLLLAGCGIVAWRGGGAWCLAPTNLRQKVLTALAVAVAGVVPAGVAIWSGYGSMQAAVCDEPPCRGNVPDPDASGRASPAPEGADADRDAPEPRTIVDGLDFATGIAFTADGRMLVTERAGTVRVVEDGILDPEPLATIPTTTDGERGLLGIAISPDEATDPAAYVFATEADGQTNRVLRVPLDGAEPEVVVPGIPGGVYHDGGGVAFDDEGNLLISNGEQHEDDRAQDPEVMGGKVYRYTPAGRLAPDNPFDDVPTFAFGLRNPFGLTVDPVSGEAFVTENGPDGHDEVNRIVRGGNYGWPRVKGIGSSSSDTYRDPLLDYPQTVVPTGIAFADPDDAAEGYGGDLFFGTFAEGTIHRVRLDDDRERVVFDTVFVNVGEPVIGVAWGPEGLYFTTPTTVRVLPIAR